MELPTISGSYIPYIPMALGLYFIVSSAAAWHRLRHFKGPWLASVSYLWMLRTSISGLSWKLYTDVNNKYGPLARIGPNDLVTDDPEIIRRMSGARSTYRRSSWYFSMRMDPYFDSMFSLRDTAAHDKLKARTAAGYGGKENPTLEVGIDEQVLSFKNLIRRKYLSKGDDLKLLDFGRTAQYFTLDVITRVSYGYAFGYLEQDRDVHEYISITEELVPVLKLGAEIPFIQAIATNPWFMKLFGPSPKDRNGIGKLMGVAQEVVAERFGDNAKDKQDMLGAFVRHGLTQRQCETEVMFQIIAGSDTTATAVRATMLYIITTPHVYQRLQEEIDDAVKTGKISDPIKSEEGRSLEYLQAVIYEGIRIHAPFTGLLMKEVPPEGDTINGQFLPGGTRIAHSSWSILRNKPAFGEDVELFRPERWLDADPVKRSEMAKTTELVFGHGRWGCAGKQVAFMELNKIFVELLRDFDIQLLNPTRAWNSTNHNLFMQHEMWVKCTERGKN